MLKDFIQSLKRKDKARGVVDLSKFEDPIAKTTKWTPTKGGGTNFRTHKLVEVASHRVEFRAVLGAKLIYLTLILMGLGAIIVFAPDLISRVKDKSIVSVILPSLPILIVCLAFAILGGCLYYFGTQPIVFDKHSGHFWKGRRDPDLVFDKDSLKVWTKLEQIHALQLIAEYCSGSKGSHYYSYELNLVLKDGERINIVDHGKLNKMREDASTLSNFLGKPVWDAT